MSIQTEIDRINANVAATYTALEEKGATMPTTRNSNNLALTVATIPSTALKAISATGTSGATGTVTNATMIQVPLKSIAGSYDDASDNAFDINSDGTLAINSSGVYLVSGSVYINPAASSAEGVVTGGCYVKKAVGTTETEILSGLDRAWGKTSGNQMTVSTGLKCVALEAGNKLKLYGRIIGGSGGTISFGNGSTYLTVIKIA